MVADIQKSTRRDVHSTFARVLLVFGALGLLRVFHEIHSVWWETMAIYKQILLLDLLLALLTIAAAVGLLRGGSWGRILAVSVGAAWLVSTVTFAYFFLPNAITFWEIWREGGEDRHLKIVGSRILFNAVTVALWPYAIWRIQKAAPPELRIRSWLAGSVVASGALVGTMLLFYPK